MSVAAVWKKFGLDFFSVSLFVPFSACVSTSVPVCQSVTLSLSLFQFLKVVTEAKYMCVYGCICCFY